MDSQLVTSELGDLATFVTTAQWDHLSDTAQQQLKIRILDSLGCAIGALGGEVIAGVRAQIAEFGGAHLCTLIGDAGQSAPDRAAFYNGALVRYLDFMDSYLAAGETCHPSDNLAAVLAAAEYAKADGRRLLAALAVAYQVQARLSDEAPVRAHGFDHPTQGAYAVGAGVARALDLDAGHAAHAIALAGVGNIALRVTRTGTLSHWKGLAYPNAAFMATHAAFLAMRGITGPSDIFAGNKGFKDSVSGPFRIDWAHEDLERVTRTITKKYNAEIHAQSAIDGVLELRQAHGIRPDAVTGIEIETFDVAYHIIGGGEEGDKHSTIRTKEQADHSLPYMVAAALCDGTLLPEQYAPARIIADDVQNLLRKVVVRPDPKLSARFPHEMPCRITIALTDGRRVTTERRDYEGFHTRPASWDATVSKFDRLAAPFAAPDRRSAIIDAVAGLEQIPVSQLTGLLELHQSAPPQG